MNDSIDPAQIVNSQPLSDFDPSRPGPSQVGTLGEELAAIAGYFQIDDATRQADRDAAWQAARWAVMPHVRAVVDAKEAAS